MISFNRLSGMWLGCLLVTTNLAFPHQSATNIDGHPKVRSATSYENDWRNNIQAIRRDEDIQNVYYQNSLGMQPEGFNNYDTIDYDLEDSENSISSSAEAVIAEERKFTTLEEQLRKDGFLQE